MTYPNSSDVAAGQPTASAHYNNLRKDALYFGQLPADSKALGDALARYAANLSLTYLATNRLRITYSVYNPPVIVIGGCLLMAGANIELASGAFSGGAATWYVHAVRGAGSTTFTLMVSTTPTDNDTTRPIGSVYYDGSTISTITSWYGNLLGFPPPSYDSGWFACAGGITYTKTHGLGSVPKSFILLHSTASDGTGENVVVLSVNHTSIPRAPIGFDSANAYIQTGTNTGESTCYSTHRFSASGYYRLLVWS